MIKTYILKFYTFIVISFIYFPAYSQGGDILWGLTSMGGETGGGTYFKYDPTIDPSKYNPTIPNFASHSLTMTPGNSPWRSLVSFNGKLYGMTSYGGTYDAGIIFEYDPATSIYTKKVDFDWVSKGAVPHGSLMVYNSKLYGMTSEGGANGYGVIFEYDPAGAGTFTKKHDFDETNGEYPRGSLIEYGNKLYGMTNSGGIDDAGVIFEYDLLTNTYLKIFEFTYDGINDIYPDGAFPHGDLLVHQDKLYGLSGDGGANYAGVLFEYDPATSTFTKKYDFDGTDGVYVNGSLVVHLNKFYGMTNIGGANGYGVIFEYNPSTEIFTKRFDFDNEGNPQGSLLVYNDKLYGLTQRTSTVGGPYLGILFSYDRETNSFTQHFAFNESTGQNPYGSLVLHNDGKMYGMTKEGGSNGVGVLFEFDPEANGGAGAYTKRLDFESSPQPSGGLKEYNGKLYGMTPYGGANNLGTLFECDPTGSTTYTKKHDFTTATGSVPNAAALVTYNNKLYGTATQGGNNNEGVIFEYDPAMETYTKIFDFDGTNGGSPVGSLVEYNDKFYGMAANGGANSEGVLFEYDPVASTYSKKVDFDGAPKGSLILYNGKLYGIIDQDGITSYGILFEYDPALSSYTVLHDFNNIVNNGWWHGGLTLYNNKFYGVTELGGTNSWGLLYEYDPATSTFAKKYDFDGTNGSPIGELTISNGKLYGTTILGGPDEAGALFEYDPATETFTTEFDFNTINGANPLNVKLLPVKIPVSLGNANACYTAPTVTIDNTNNNEWVHVRDHDGNMIAEINANGNTLGTVTTNFYINTNTVRENTNKTLYLDRNITITPQFQPTTPVDVRFFIKGSEFDALKNATNSLNQPSGINIIDDIYIFKNDDGCISDINNSPVQLTTGNGVYNVSDYYLYGTVNSFSSFYFGINLNNPLPVKLKLFIGKKAATSNQLKWEAECTESTQFELQHSTDGVNFSTIYTVQASINSCQIPSMYDHINPPAALNYYRLKMTESSGGVTHSNIVFINNKGSADLLQLTPNTITNNRAVLKAVVHNTTRMELMITDLLGRKMWVQTQTLQPGVNNLTLDVSNLSAGTYQLYGITATGEHTSVLRFVKQ